MARTISIGMPQISGAGWSREADVQSRSRALPAGNDRHRLPRGDPIAPETTSGISIGDPTPSRHIRYLLNAVREQFVDQVR